jgi:hypothetical protein
MTYDLNSRTLLFEIDRTAITDIAVGDELTAKDFPNVHYIWTQQDSQFVETNPDARIFLKMKRGAKGEYEGAGMKVIQE